MRALLADEPPLSMVPDRSPATINILLNAPPRVKVVMRATHFTVPDSPLGLASVEGGAVLKKINKIINGGARR